MTHPDSEESILASAEQAWTRPGRVWRHHGGLALGDTWMLAQWITRQRQPVRISSQLPARDGGAEAMRALLPRCLALLAGGSADAVDWRDVPQDQTQPLPRQWLWGHEPVPARTTWDGGSGGHICIQLEGVSGAKAKNVPRDDVWALLDTCRGLAIVPLGLPHTIEEAILDLSHCRLFIGVCSGMSHLAHSVGCPRIVIEYKQAVGPWQPPESARFRIARGTPDAIAIATQMLAQASP